MVAAGLVLWLTDFPHLTRAPRPYYPILAGVAVLPLAAPGAQIFAWGMSGLQDATIYSAAFLLRLIGQPVISEPSEALMRIGDFEVLVLHQCSGLSGIVMVSAVACGYVITLRSRLRMGRALLLIPIGAGLS